MCNTAGFIALLIYLMMTIITTLAIVAKYVVKDDVIKFKKGEIIISVENYKKYIESFSMLLIIMFPGWWLYLIVLTVDRIDKKMQSLKKVEQE